MVILNLYKMKTTISKFLFVVFLSVIVIGIQAQNVKTNLNQKELVKQFEGKWQAPSGKDSVEVWEWQPYGNAYSFDITVIANKKESSNYKNFWYYDNNLGKFYGAQIFHHGWWAGGWNGLFTEQNKLVIDYYPLSDPAKILSKIEFVIDSKDKFTMTSKIMATGKVSVWKFTRVK